MRVQDIMTKRVVTIGGNASVEAARNLMRQQAIQHLVVEDGGTVAGVLSARDAVRARREGIAVADVMSRPVVTIAPDATVKKAANLMRGRSIGSLVVIAKERPVGIITVTDLLELIGKGDTHPAPPARPILRHRVPHRKRNTAAGAW